MNCETALELISQALDGELSKAQQEELQAHMQSCPQCRALQAELSGIHEACGKLEVSPPAELKKQIMTSLPSQRPSKAVYWKRWGALAAALAIVAMTAWRLPHYLYEDRGVSPESAETVSADTQGPVNTQQAAVDSSDMSGLSDENLPVFTSGGIMDADVQSDAAAPPLDAPTPRPTDYPVASKNYKGSAPMMSSPKIASSEPSQPVFTAATEPDAAEGDAENSIAPLASGEGGFDAAPTATAACVRMALVPDVTAAIAGEDETAVATEAVDNTIPEIAPDVGASELPLGAEELEPVSEEPDLFAAYCGVLTVESYEPQEVYPSLLMESGEIWYSLPAEDFSTLVQQLEGSEHTYELRLSGDDIAPDAPEGLVIVKASVEPGS